MTSSSESNLRALIQDLANANDAEALRSASKEWPDLFVEAQHFIPKGLISDTDHSPKHLLIPAFVASLFRRLWLSDDEAIAQLEVILLNDGGLSEYPSGFLRADWRRGKLAYRPHAQIQHALHFLLENSTMLRHCGNPDCEAPYFIAGHGNDRYCKKKCFNKARRDAKRAWWDEHGEDWRNARERLTKKRKGKLK